MTRTTATLGTRGYDSSLRKAQADETHRQIVAAAYELLKTTHPHSLSYALLAEQTGITQRTIYRHFPERGDLYAAVARTHVEKYLGEPARASAEPRVWAEQLRSFHEMLSREPGAYRVMLAAPTRDQGGAAAFIEATLGAVLPRVPPDQRTTMKGVWEVFFSPYFWEVLHTHHGVSADRITRAAIVMMSLTLDAFERDPELFDIARPVPRRFRDAAADSPGTASAPASTDKAMNENTKTKQKQKQKSTARRRA